jgi:hypothetical protein
MIKAALKRLRIYEGALHRVRFVARRQTLDGRHFPARRTERGKQARMHRRPVHPDRAGAAIASVAAFLDAKGAAIA